MPDGSNVAPSWLKTGKDANAAHQAHEAKVAKAAEAANKMRRFWLETGGEAQITFLDGALDSDGMLQFTGFNEHTVQVGGQWDQFVCVAESEICPICNGGDRASYVGAFTVLVHTPYTIKKGQNQGKVIQNYRQLYVAKSGTLRKLQTYATKRGGLTGWRIEVSRTGDKDPRVGDSFQFLEQKTLPELEMLYGKESFPADYSKEISYLSAKELIKMGVGKAPTGPGLSSNGGTIDTKELSDQM